jgi:hypothetical protein
VPKLVHPIRARNSMKAFFLAAEICAGMPVFKEVIGG